VRGKTIEAILADLEGRKDLSVTAGVPDVLTDLLSMPGPGEWQT
jgi:hypothetical protein